jgi:hypothetical protein
VNTTACTGWGTGAATGCTSDPLSSFSGSSAISTLSTTYGNSFTAVNTSGSWPGSFEMVDNGNFCKNSVTSAGSPTTTSANGLIVSYVYTFNYQLCSTGRAQSLQQVLVKETGSYVLTVQAQTSSKKTVEASFASFGAFIDNFDACSAPLVPGTISGPTFTNGSWNWGTSGSYIYTDPVGQSGAKASYWFGSTCAQVAASSDSCTSGSCKGQSIKPTFQQGFNLAQDKVTLPSNDFSQQWAILDGKGTGEGTSAPGNSDLSAGLMDGNKKAYGSSGAGSVFMPYCTSGPTCTPNTINGGGIYVNAGSGGASITLSTGTDSTSAKNPTQIYTIKVGSTTTTITTDLTTSQTTMQVGSGTATVLSGVPMNYNASPPQAATLLYVNGTVTGLTGPGQGKAGIADGSQITVAGSGDIDITGDLIYAHEPVTLNTSDTLVANQYNSSGTQIAGDFNSVLGIFTANGNINLSSPYKNGNLETDASLAAINSSCKNSNSCGFATPSDTISTWTIVGGRIESNAHSVSISQGNTYFDRRFTSKAGFAPPFFPATTLPQVDIQNASAPLVTASQQRLSWVAYPQ